MYTTRGMARQADEDAFHEEEAAREREENPPPFRVERTTEASDCDGLHGPHTTVMDECDRTTLEAMIGSEMFTAESKGGTETISVEMYTGTDNRGVESGSVDIRVGTEEGHWAVTLEWEQIN